MILSLFALMGLSAYSCSNDGGKNCSSKKDCSEECSEKGATSSEESAKKEAEIKATVQKFYDALSTAPAENAAETMAEWMATDWTSTPTPPGGPEMAGFIKTLHMFHGMIPDLNWKVEEMLVDGNRVIVRSTATGTPNSPEGYFFGVPTDGSKSFKIQTIDIHTVENGKMVRGYHCEDWEKAIQQVTASEYGH